MATKYWTRADDKRFETALAQFPDNSPTRFEDIASNLQIPFVDVIYYYDALLHDIDLIESGQYDTITYPEDDVAGISSQTKHMGTNMKKGTPWTENEHKSFLEGLDKYGKGDWRSISRFMQSRTPTQVASHAQKYFLRQSVDKAKKRSSIHDIASVDNAANNGTVPPDDFLGIRR